MREDRLDDATLDVCEHGRPNHQDLIRQLLEALGKGTHARAQTPQAVFEECLTECRRLRATETAARAAIQHFLGRWGDCVPPWDLADYLSEPLDRLRAALSAASTEPAECDIGGGTSTPNDANAGLHHVAGWLSLRCGFCGHWSKGEFTKDHVAEWLRVHRNAMVGPNEGHTTTASTCPNPCGSAASAPTDEPERCDSRSPVTDTPCVLVAGHDVRHCGPPPEPPRRYRERWPAAAPGPEGSDRAG